MKSTTVPVIRYRDAKRAMDWLCVAFGFDVFLNVPGVDGRIEHARLVLGGNMIMLASLGRDGGFEDRFRSPASVDGVTQCTSIVVGEPDVVYARATRAGASIVSEIEDFEFGGRGFGCEDIESHLWLFTSHDPWKKIW